MNLLEHMGKAAKTGFLAIGDVEYGQKKSGTGGHS